MRSVPKSDQYQLADAHEDSLSAPQAEYESLARISHEIRTPMNAVLGMAELLADTKLNVEQRKYVDILVSNGNVLLDLIDDILDLGKVRAEPFELEQTEFDLIDLVERVCATLAIRAHTKHLELVCDVTRGVPTHVLGDASRLRQILFNLVGNAIKFTEVGAIVLTVKKEDETGQSAVLHFSVADSGVGIAQNKVGRIFNSFLPADPAIARGHFGTGFGLAIVKRLVELMGGQIWAASEVGKGTEVHFTARFEFRAAPIHAETTVAPRDLMGVRTLVVDDTSVNRTIVREMLQAKGALVTEAASGEDALSKYARALATEEPFELLVVDYRMPAMDGLEMARRVGSGISGHPMLVLMLTSDDLSVTAARMRELGVEACLVKPIRRAELYRVIATAMAQARTVAPGFEQRSVLEPPLRILLAEDTFESRLLVEAYLKSTHYHLDTAENGEIAVRKFTSAQYDLILMDIQMPVMDGYAATRAIRRLEREHGLARTPIIALSASAFPEDVRKALESGCDLHVSKPVKKATVIAAIRGITRRSQGLTISHPTFTEGN
jgi:two-component system sensor histidine kinase/response regulator